VLLDQLKDHLREKQVLLLLDNFEQVARAAIQVADLLTVCPRLKMLVTSREALHVRAEQEFAVPALVLPDAKRLPTLAAYVQSEAVALFLARVQAAQPHFQLTLGNAPTIAQMCAHLDGLPLALELAAPRLKLLSPQELLARLEGRLQVLTGGARDLPERQRTMHATIAWSYELLSSAEQALFRRLAVFAGGWTLEAAECVCSAAGALELDVLEGLSSLLDKSLLRQEQAVEGKTRFQMLYVLREFGLERLEAEGELAATREAHATFFLSLAEEAEPLLRGKTQKGWLERLEQEHDNLRAALNWSLERAEQAERQAAEYALRLGGSLLHFWVDRICFREGVAFLERALAWRVGVSEAVQVKALVAAAHLLVCVAELERGEALSQEALALARQEGDTHNIAFALAMLGMSALSQNQYPLARASYEEAAVLFQQAGDAWWRGLCLRDFSEAVRIQGEYERAQALQEECLALFRTLGDQQQVGATLTFLGWTCFTSSGELTQSASLVEQGLALLHEVGEIYFTPFALSTLGVIRRHQGRLSEARELLEENLAICQEQAMHSGIFNTRNELARLLAQQGELAGAQALYQENQALLPTSGGKDLIAEYLEGRGALEAALGRPETAARLWGAAEALREAIGAPMYPVYRDANAQAVAVVCTKLGEGTFAAAWAEGLGMAPEEALAAADQKAPFQMTDEPLTKTSVRTAAPEGLTPRELEVLRLLAQGLTNPQIAERLVISPLTVHGHLKVIYSKLGVTTRTAAALYARDHHLL
jgi:predicted ATPase/DNA-binding CsgD family transcriptional regulator